MQIKKIYDEIKKKLVTAKIENASFEAICLMEQFLNIDRTALSVYGDKDADETAVMLAASERASGRPLQYILKCCDFYGYDFSVGEGVLVPRFDTEVIIDISKKMLAGTENPKIIDLCSGSGAIALTLKKEIKDAEIFALEKSESALKYLNENKRKLSADVTVISADVMQGIPNEISNISFDMVVSNPPYITQDEMNTLPDDVKMEPHEALFGGIDGLDFYRKITALYKDMIAENGVLLFEIGKNQGVEVSRILSENGFSKIIVETDLSGNDRAVYGKKILKP